MAPWIASWHGPQVPRGRHGGDDRDGAAALSEGDHWSFGGALRHRRRLGRRRARGHRAARCCCPRASGAGAEPSSTEGPAGHPSARRGTGARAQDPSLARAWPGRWRGCGRGARAAAAALWRLAAGSNRSRSNRCSPGENGFDDGNVSAGRGVPPHFRRESSGRCASSPAAAAAALGSSAAAEVRASHAEGTGADNTEIVVNGHSVEHDADCLHAFEAPGSGSLVLSKPPRLHRVWPIDCPGSTAAAAQSSLGLCRNGARPSCPWPLSAERRRCHVQVGRGVGPRPAPGISRAP